MASCVALLGLRLTTPRCDWKAARRSAWVFPYRPMCPRIQAAAVGCALFCRAHLSSISMPDLRVAPLSSQVTFLRPRYSTRRKVQMLHVYPVPFQSSDAQVNTSFMAPV